MLLPFLPIERPGANILDRPWIQAPHVDVKSMGMGPGNVERFDAAVATKKMLRRAGVESVGGQTILAL